MQNKVIEQVARALCSRRGYDPDQLEPGDAPGIDGYLANGDPAHFLWKAFARDAEAAVSAVSAALEDFFEWDEEGAVAFLKGDPDPVGLKAG